VKRDLYAEVSARIVAELERGAAPWIKPWSATAGQNVPQNAVTNRLYSGCNVILLWLARNRGWATPRFLTKPHDSGRSCTVSTRAREAEWELGTFATDK
jgi:antirestriction protein ArdC